MSESLFKEFSRLGAPNPSLRMSAEGLRPMSGFGGEKAELKDVVESALADMCPKISNISNLKIVVPKQTLTFGGRQYSVYSQGRKRARIQGMISPSNEDISLIFKQLRKASHPSDTSHFEALSQTAPHSPTPYPSLPPLKVPSSKRRKTSMFHLPPLSLKPTPETSLRMKVPSTSTDQGTFSNSRIRSETSPQMTAEEKRVKNREAARQCRQRKRLYLKSLEQMLGSLTDTRKKLKEKLRVRKKATQYLMQQYGLFGEEMRGNSLMLAVEDDEKEVVKLLLSSEVSLIESDSLFPETKGRTPPTHDRVSQPGHEWDPRELPVGRHVPGPMRHVPGHMRHVPGEVSRDRVSEELWSCRRGEGQDGGRRKINARMARKAYHDQSADLAMVAAWARQEAEMTSGSPALFVPGQR
ncbi:hypothetical protein AAMO2058_001315400 [Amorphochlora amoebiformis]